MLLTNGQRGDLIDALEIAIETLRSYIDSNLPPTRSHWNQEDKDNYSEWSTQRKRFTKLRRGYLKEERTALPVRSRKVSSK